jgi:Amt family ammonium transporter
MSAALVMLMTPGLALFYGGLVRRKNLLSTMMMSFTILGLIGVLWILYGYSLSFGTDYAGIIGGFDFIGLRNVGQTPSSVYAPTVPHLAFMIYQAMFAIIAVALFTGAVVERMKFSSLLVFAVVWFTLVYVPVAHWVWGGGWLAKLGVLDFAGGIVVHITAGVSAFALALVLGPRKGYRIDSMEPNSIPLVVLGGALLWFGWFGFNAGSALQANGLASSAFVTTYSAGAVAGMTWLLLSWIYRRPTILGTVTGSVVGLAAVTPAAGFVSPLAGMAIGLVASLIAYYAMLWRNKSRLDESLDVWACHGLGGTWGTLAAGIFASTTINAVGADGIISGNPLFFVKQLIGVVAVWAFAFVISYGLARLLKATMGLRVSGTEEALGLDISQHGERAYGGTLR